MQLALKYSPSLKSFDAKLNICCKCRDERLISAIAKLVFVQQTYKFNFKEI